MNPSKSPDDPTRTSRSSSRGGGTKSQASRTRQGSRGGDGEAGGPRSDDDRLAVLLCRDVAEELLDLIRDVEGDADEDLLDEAVRDLHRAATGRLASVPRGSVVLRLRPDERALLVSLITEKPVDAHRVAKVGDRLAARLARTTR